MNEKTSKNHPNRVLIIGLDGATFDLIRPWAEEGRLPTLQRLMEEGSWGELNVELPPGTIPNWPSFATGKNPGKHGLIWWVKQKRETFDAEVISSEDLRGQTMWDIAGDNGLQVGIVNMPMAYPPYPVNGFMISGLLTPPTADIYTYPKELRHEIESQLGEYRIFPQTLFRKGNEAAYLEDLHRTLETRYKTTRFLMRNKPWSLFAVVFGATDWAMHAYWKYQDPQHPRHDASEAQKYGHAIRSIYEHIDEVVKGLLDEIDENTHVIIMSDHGAGPAVAKSMLNNWLLNIGLLKIKRAPISQIKYLLFRMGFTPEKIYPWVSKFKLLNVRLKRTLDPRRKGRQSLLRRIFLSFNDVDWTRTKAYTLGGMGQIHINLRGRNKFGCVSPGKEYEELCEYIIQRLQEIRLPGNGQPFVKQVYRRDELYHGMFIEDMPDLLVMPSDMRYLDSGIEFFTNRMFSELDVNSGAHRTNGVFILWGPHAKKGIKIKGVSIRDIAPTTLYLLGLAIPEDMDGKVVVQSLSDEYVAKFPIKFTQVDEELSSSRGGFASKEDEELIKQRLASLGYLDT